MACISNKKIIYIFPTNKKSGSALPSPYGLLSPRGSFASVFGMGTGMSSPPSPPPRIFITVPGNRANSNLYHIRPFRSTACSAHNICARQASRAIGAPRLCTSRCLRLASINRVYFPGPFMEHVQRRTDPGAGFALRCSQRLSVPRAAARPWDWRPNRCTVASSPPVLAYWGGIP